MAMAAGDYDRAYAYYNEYLTKYPKGDDFDQALEGMYEVGQKFLEGARRQDVRGEDVPLDGEGAGDF